MQIQSIAISGTLYNPKESISNCVCAVINWVGLYQRTYFSPQPKLSLFNKYWSLSCLAVWVRSNIQNTRIFSHTRAEFHMTTSALWDKQARRWSGVTPAGRLPGCGVLPCCDSILSVPVCALPLLQGDTFLTWAARITLRSLSYCISHTPSSVVCSYTWLVFAQKGVSQPELKGNLSFMLQGISMENKTGHKILIF